MKLRFRFEEKRSRNMTFLRVMVSRKDSDLDEKQDTVKDFREQISIMEQLLASLKSLYTPSLKGWLYGQDYFSLEYIAHKEEIYFYIVVPKRAKMLVEKQIVGFYPDCAIEETEEINIFEGRKVVRGEIMKLKKDTEFPIRTYQKLESRKKSEKPKNKNLVGIIFHGIHFLGFRVLSRFSWKIQKTPSSKITPTRMMTMMNLSMKKDLWRKK
jgi:hypothetical protein